jgi:hypothetical protein
MYGAVYPLLVWRSGLSIYLSIGKLILLKVRTGRVILKRILKKIY